MKASRIYVRIFIHCCYQSNSCKLRNKIHFIVNMRLINSEKMIRELAVHTECIRIGTGNEGGMRTHTNKNEIKQKKREFNIYIQMTSYQYEANNKYCRNVIMTEK